MTYTNICVCLDGYWEKPWRQLPKEQRQAWHEALGSLGGTSKHDGQVWDGQDVEGRRYVAEFHDIQHDPAMRDDKEGRAHKELGFWRAVARDLRAADWDHWLSLQSWTLRESACLLTELDPREYDRANSNINPQPRGLVERIADIERRADREQKAGRLRDNPSPTEWAEWAKVSGYALPKRLRVELEAAEKLDPGSESDTVRSGAGGTATTPSLTEIRIAAIVEIATQLKYDPLSVATGGKAAIEAECLDKLKGAPQRFTADTFKKAWQAARDAGRIDVENANIYRGQ